MGCQHLQGSGGYRISLWSVRTSALIVCVLVQSLMVAVSNLSPPSRRVDKDRSGVISDTELQQALSNGNQRSLVSPFHFTPLLWLLFCFCCFRGTFPLPWFQLSACLSLFIPLFLF